MSTKNSNSRRRFLQQSAAASAITLTAMSLESRLGAADAVGGKGNINHSACKWCYPKVSLDELCTAGKDFGLTSVDLLRPSDFPTLKKHGMTCAMVSGPSAKGPNGKSIGGITRAWNRVENHDALVAAYENDIPIVSNAGLTNLICFSGNRAGMDDELGLHNCAKGLKTSHAIGRETQRP